MRVFIAEKPSLGKAIAAVLPGPQKRHKTHIESGESNVVVWCAGHIMEQYYPEDYDPALKKWTTDSLPIEPEEWRMKVSARTKDLYATIKRHVKDATRIVHAGDPDREGQLLVDEVLMQLGVDVPVQRLLISDLNPAAVKRALSKLEKNSDFEGLRDAALGRSRADWLYGLNLTRLYTVLGRAGGYDSVLSVGRVQTPVLGLVVRRDLEIEAFTAKPFYTLSATVKANTGEFIAHWLPDCPEFQDEDGRVIDRHYTEQVASHLVGYPGAIDAVKTQHKKDAAPLPFSLPELQKVASRGRGLSPKKTLAVAQSLYEKHQALTYPRSDCRYLPLEHWAEGSEVRDGIAQSVGEQHPLHAMTDAVDLIHRGKCWNDKKITAHHAIIPTKKCLRIEAMTADERWVYKQVAHRYLLQFCVDREFDQTDVVLHITGAAGEECFKSRGIVETQPGWTRYKAVLSSPAEDSQSNEKESDATTSLPALTKGEVVRCTACDVIEKTTSPPKRFTEATLLDAMTGIARFVQDPDIKKKLKDTDGLGTPATQATIIDTLFKRGYLEKQKKVVSSTTLGRDLIKTLPLPATLPDLTARWEQQLAAVEHGELTLDSFMIGVTESTRALIGEGKSLGSLTLEGVVPGKTKKVKKTAAPQHDCPGKDCDGRLRRIKGSKGFFWGCTNFKAGCKETRPDSKGKPGRVAKTKGKAAAGARKTSQPAKVGDLCPECKKGTIAQKMLKTGENAGKSFKACTSYPKCRYFAWPDAQVKRTNLV